MAYEVRAAGFEGPFDLLLHLITRDEMDLYEISLSGIVDAYLSELDRMGPLDLDVATEFLVIAAVLVDLKCRRLLPGPVGIAAEDDLVLLEERDLLVARLVECMTFRAAGDSLARMAAGAALSVPRTAGLEPRFLALAPDPLAGVVAADLHSAYVRAVTPKVAPRVDLGHVAPLRTSVADAVGQLCAHLADSGPVSFVVLTSGIEERVEVIVRFLAVLELYKQGLVELDQTATFGDLKVTWTASPGIDARDNAVGALAAVDAYDG
ncbi:MAG: segregation and condensation protein A [Acidimicrobiales bacterium]